MLSGLWWKVDWSGRLTCGGWDYPFGRETRVWSEVGGERVMHWGEHYRVWNRWLRS